MHTVFMQHEWSNVSLSAIGSNIEQMGHSSSSDLTRPFVNRASSFPAATHSMHLRRLFLILHCLPLKDSLGSSLSHAPQIFMIRLM